jgi:hypothetical protein
MGYQLANGTKLREGVAWTDPDGIQRPANWLKLSTERDRELLGITWVEEANQVWDQKFYKGYDDDGNLIPKRLEDENAVGEDGEAALDADGNQIVNTGLKTLWKAKQNEIAASLLNDSDKRVIKALDEATTFAEFKAAKPANYTTYRAAVRTACNTRQGEIDACSDVAALKELLFGSAQIQQTDDNGDGVVDDDGNPVMIANPNIATAWPDPVE